MFVLLLELQFLISSAYDDRTSLKTHILNQMIKLTLIKQVSPGNLEYKAYIDKIFIL